MIEVRGTRETTHAHEGSRPAGTDRRRLFLVVLSGLGVTVAALAAGLFLARRAFDSSDAQVMYAVARAIVETHTTIVPRAEDPLGMNSPHSSYGLGQSLVELPGYLVGVATGRDPRSIVMLTNPFVFALVVLAMWGWARAARATAGQAAAVAAVTGFGTLPLAYVSTGGSEIGTALGVAIAILGVELAGERPLRGAAVAGAGVGVAVLFRPDSALLIAVPVTVAILTRTRRGFPLFVLAAAPFAIETLIYNGARGGTYAGFTLSQSFGHPIGAGIYGLLLSPGRGLVFYVPLFLPVLLAVPWAWRRSPTITCLCLALLLVRIPFYAAWFAWQGGWSWGPRFFGPVMPCLAPFVFEFVRRLSLARRDIPLAAAAALVVTVSVSVQVLGAAVRYDTDTANLTMSEVWSPTPESIPQDRVMADWRYFPIYEHLRDLAHGRNLARGYRGGVGLPYN